MNTELGFVRKIKVIILQRKIHLILKFSLVVAPTQIPTTMTSHGMLKRTKFFQPDVLLTALAAVTVLNFFSEEAGR